MSQLIDNLNIIESVKTDIKTAIENKGVDMTGVSFPGYASKIGEITTSFVTVPLNVSANGTYTPSEGVNGYSQVVVDVPQSVTGFTQKNLTEGTVEIINLDNSASFVASNAFNGNQTIKTVNLPYATSVGASAFLSCTSLSQVNLPVCSFIGYQAFCLCTSLSQISLPVCSHIGYQAFMSCYSLSKISLPKCSYIDVWAFQMCYSLNQVSLPVCSFISDRAFVDCSSLSQISLPVCSIIGYNEFDGCSSLSIITIGYSGVCNLKNSQVFNATQITSSTGSIYVPASLVDSYKSATNWSYFSTQIFPISE